MLANIDAAERETRQREELAQNNLRLAEASTVKAERNCQRNEASGG